MNKDERALARKELAEKAAGSYEEGHTLMEVAEELGVSYGKAHALVKEGGATIRPRGARFVPPVAPEDDAAAGAVPGELARAHNGDVGLDGGPADDR